MCNLIQTFKCRVCTLQGYRKSEINEDLFGYCILFLVGGPDSTPDLFCPLSGLEKNWVQGYLVRVGQTKPLPRNYCQCLVLSVVFFFQLSPSFSSSCLLLILVVFFPELNSLEPNFFLIPTNGHRTEKVRC